MKRIVVDGGTEVDIQKAIDSLGPEGGTIELLGKFTINNSVLVSKDDVTLHGRANSALVYKEGARLDLSGVGCGIHNVAMNSGVKK